MSSCQSAAPPTLVNSSHSRWGINFSHVRRSTFYVLRSWFCSRRERRTENGERRMVQASSPGADVRRVLRAATTAAAFLAVLAGATPAVRGQSGARNGEWPTYGGELANTRYSPLDQ